MVKIEELSIHAEPLTDYEMELHRTIRRQSTELESLQARLATQQAAWESRWCEQHAAWDQENELRRDAEAALATQQAALRELVEKWRDTSSRLYQPTGFLLCADELARLLVAEPGEK